MGKHLFRFLIHLSLTALLLAGCGNQGETPPSAQTPVPVASGPQGTEVLFRNGTILTMEDSRPSAEAVLIRGEKIVAVGSESEVQAQAGSQAIQIDLQGKVLVPGFIDSHQYRIQKRSDVGITDPSVIIQTAIEQGWTSLDELYVEQSLMNELVRLDQAGTLRVRVNAYLPFMQYDANGTKLGDWYEAYHQNQIVSPHVRVGGLIGFTDFDNANAMLWRQDDLNAFLLKAQQGGWKVALKTVSTRSLEMILKAYEYVQTVDPNVVNSRGQLEHALFITPDQIQRIKSLGLIPIINLNNPGQLVGEADVDALIAREPEGSYTPWRSLSEADVVFANASGWPSYYVDEPSGAPFGSPMHLIYQAVTRVGNLGKQPYPWLLNQTLTAEQAMRALTINGAYTTFEENVKGSLAPGKLADLAILSDNPLTVPASEINNIHILMTMIGGKVEYCAVGFESTCPSAPASTAANATHPPAAQVSYPYATASQSLPDHSPSYAIDGSTDTWWSAGAGPEQWIQIDLGKPATVNAIRLVISQYPEGETDHQIWVGADPGTLTLIHEFKGLSKDLDALEFNPAAPLANIRFIKIVTIQSPSWVAWRQIEIH